MIKQHKHIMIFLEKNKDRWVPQAEVIEEVQREYPKADIPLLKKFLKEIIDIADSWNHELNLTEYRHITWRPGEREKELEDRAWFDALPDTITPLAKRPTSSKKTKPVLLKLCPICREPKDPHKMKCERCKDYPLKANIEAEGYRI